MLEAAADIPVKPGILDAARQRTDVGNPPGKRGSLGDAINWECLLGGCADGDLHLVTGDGDYTSALLKQRVRPYLAKEWESRRTGDVRLYRRISEFLKEHFPDINLAIELEKELRIRALEESGSFDATHRAVARLASYTEYSPQQAADLLEAAESNSQIHWIANDPDVRGFFQRLRDSQPESLDA